MADTRDKKKFSKDAFTTVGESEGFQPKGNQTDPTIGPGKNGKSCDCGCDPCTCGDKKKVKEEGGCTYPIPDKTWRSRQCGKGPIVATISRASGPNYSLCQDCANKLKGQGMKVHYYEKKESQVNREAIINRMIEQGYSKADIKAVLKEMESEAVERAEEKLGKDLDGDGEKGESKAHKDKVLGKKESIQALIDRMVERGLKPNQIKAVLKEMETTPLDKARVELLKARRDKKEPVSKWYASGNPKTPNDAFDALERERKAELEYEKNRHLVKPAPSRGRVEKK